MSSKEQRALTGPLMDRKPCTGCTKPLGINNKSGLCRACLCHRMNSDPDISARREAGQQAYLAKPETKAELARRIIAAQANLPEREIVRRREMGRALIVMLHNPETKAKALAARMQPEPMARRGRSVTRTRLPWCPEEFWPLYRSLTSKGALAAEARAAIEPLIPGTEAHAKRLIANTNLAMQIKQEREKAQAY